MNRIKELELICEGIVPSIRKVATVPVGKNGYVVSVDTNKLLEFAKNLNGLYFVIHNNGDVVDGFNSVRELKNYIHPIRGTVFAHYATDKGLNSKEYIALQDASFEKY